MARSTAMPRQVIRDFGTCLSFVAANSAYVRLKSGFILGGLTNSSVSMWIKIPKKPAVNGGQALYCERAGSGNDIYKFEIRGNFSGVNGAIQFTYRDDAGTLTQVTGLVDICDNRWHHVVVTKSGTSIVLYVDTVTTTGTLTGNDTFTNSSTPETRLGGDPQDITVYGTGRMDEITIYNVALTPTNVSDLFYGYKRSITGCIGNWKCDEGSGTTLNDSVGSNNGVITNATYSTDVFMVPRSAVA